MNNEIMLSIVMPTYNHEKYVKKALDSVIMQQTTFKYELLISDDCSKDNTAHILLEYKRKYPDLIRLCLRKKNVGATKNGYALLKNAKGKYIAVIDGDDYWTDEKKLEKQVRFLEENPQYSAVLHECDIIDEYDRKLKIEYNDWYYAGEKYTFTELERGILPGQTSSLVYLNYFKQYNKDYSIIYKAHNLVGDQTQYAISLTLGNIYCMKEVMGIYRFVNRVGKLNAASITSSKNATWDMWKYYYKLERYISENWGYTANFSMLRSRELQNALEIFKRGMTPQNGIIMLKIAFINTICEIVKAVQIKKKASRNKYELVE